MRQYQNWLRSEIHEREQAVRAESVELSRTCAALYGDIQKGGCVWNGETLTEGQALDVCLEMGDRIAALDRDAAVLGAEISIRDKPVEDQEQYGGPGRD